MSVGFSCRGSPHPTCTRSAATASNTQISASAAHGSDRAVQRAVARTQSAIGRARRRVVHEPELGDFGDRLGQREQRRRACAPRRDGSCRRSGARRTRRTCRPRAPRRRPRAGETTGSRPGDGCRGCAARCAAARRRDRTRAGGAAYRAARRREQQTIPSACAIRPPIARSSRRRRDAPAGPARSRASARARPGLRAERGCERSRANRAQLRLLCWERYVEVVPPLRGGLLYGTHRT